MNISGSWICLWFRICQGFEQTRVLNKSGLWIYQGSEYSSGSEFARVLNMSGLHRVLNMPDYSWLCRAEYGWICLNIPGYAWICLNLPEWLLFYISPLNPLSTWRRGYLFQRLHKTRGFSLNENEAVFLERHNLIW